MINNTIQTKLVRARHELQSLKISTPLNYGQLRSSDGLLMKGWHGRVNNSSHSDLAALWIAKFKRTDGIKKPPFVDFAWDYTLSKGYYDDIISAGFSRSFSGRDSKAIDEMHFTEGVEEVGEDYVSWQIGISSLNWFYYSENGTNLSLDVQAISMVNGELNLERII